MFKVTDIASEGNSTIVIAQIDEDVHVYEIRFTGNTTNIKDEIDTSSICTLNYECYKDENQITNNAEMVQLAKAIIKYDAQHNKGTLHSAVELGFYVFAHSNGQECNCFYAETPITKKYIDTISEQYLTNNQKNFLSMMVCSGGRKTNDGTDEVEYTSTLIIDTRSNIAYILDTSEDAHHKVDRTGVDKNYINIPNQIFCLNTIVGGGLQGDANCAMWTAIINAKLVQENNIDNISIKNIDALDIIF